ncbi:MAG: DUF1295 domain-containing protein [Bacteroidaceae bacterium]|nr:DUF1295 domain-containing protein [Bacteroidaceae bacterium]
MLHTYFTYFLMAMSCIAIIVFVCLYFVTAGYGQFRTRQWGWSIPNKTAWVLMEAPAFLGIIGVLCYALSRGCAVGWPAWFLFVLFEFHYFQRSFVFPLLMKGKSLMPVAIVLMGVVFNLLNAAMQGGGLFLFPPTDLQQSFGRWFLQGHVVAGVVLFVVGLAVNWHSDHVIRHLRQPGDTRHYLPEKGMYRYVTSANYLGELLEWTGFAIAAATPAAWVFVWWTAANLVPRAHAIHKKYRQEFGEAVGRRKRILPFIY